MVFRLFKTGTGLFICLCLLFSLFACAGAPATSPAGGVITAPSSAGAAAGTHLAFPAPSLTIYQTTEAYGEDLLYADYDGNFVGEVSLPTSDGTYYAHFASDEVLFYILKEEGDFSARTSHNGGATWASAPLGSLPSAEYLDFKAGYFTSQNGWVACTYQQGSTYMATFYTTQNGGASWQQTVASTLPGKLNTVAFATSSLGLATFFEQPGAYQTTDGGLTWQPCAIEVPQQILEKTTTGKYGTATVCWNGQYWSMQLMFAFKPPYWGSRLTFILKEDGSGWVPAPAPAALPDGIGFAELEGYFNTIQLPASYTASGSPYAPDFSFLNFLYRYLEKAGRAQIKEKNGSSYCLISEQDMADMALYLYGSSSLDLSNLDYEFSGGTLYFTVPEFGTGWSDIVYHAISVTPQGEIEIVWDRILAGDGPSGRGYPGGTHNYERCTFTPVTSKDGIQLFTLVSMEKLSALPQ